MIHKLLEELTFSPPVLSLYDGEDEGNTVVLDPATPVDSGDSSGLGLNNDDPDAQIKVDPNARFTQDQLNKIVQDRLAKERKKQADKVGELEKSYQDLLANQAMTDEQRQALETNLENLRKQSRSKEENAKLEKLAIEQQYQTQINQLQEKAGKWETRFKSFLIEKSLLDAAVAHDSVIPQQILSVVSPWTKLVDVVDENNNPTGNLTPMVELEEIDAETGKTITTQRTPMDAIEKLKELQPNLFKSNVAGGVGSNSTTGGASSGADGQIDAATLTPAQYIKLLRDDPSKLGLSNRRKYH